MKIKYRLDNINRVGYKEYHPRWWYKRYRAILTAFYMIFNYRVGKCCKCGLAWKNKNNVFLCGHIKENRK